MPRERAIRKRSCLLWAKSGHRYSITSSARERIVGGMDSDRHSRRNIGRRRPWVVDLVAAKTGEWLLIMFAVSGNSFPASARR